MADRKNRNNKQPYLNRDQNSVNRMRAQGSKPKNRNTVANRNHAPNPNSKNSRTERDVPNFKNAKGSLNRQRKVGNVNPTPQYRNKNRNTAQKTQKEESRKTRVLPSKFTTVKNEKTMSNKNHTKEGSRVKSFFKRNAALIGFFATILVASLILFPIYAINKIDGSFNVSNASDLLLSKNRPTPTVYTDEFKGRSFNMVIIGTDRGIEGADGHISYRSDTTIVAHVSADRKYIDLVSIPRDSIVDFPECKMSNGEIKPPRKYAQFNWAFSSSDSMDSSIACTISTIEHNTGVFIDTYAVVDYSSFKTIVDELGGVPITVKEHMVSKEAGLDLLPGEHILNGDQALSFARARKFQVGSGDGSDLGRIERQQYLMGQMIKKASSIGILGNPTKAVDTLSTMVSEATVGKEIGSVDRIVPILMEAKDAEIDFHTVPVVSWVYDPNRVIWTEEADRYWQSMIDDVPIDNSEKTGYTDNTNQPAE